MKIYYTYKGTQIEDSSLTVEDIFIDAKNKKLTLVNRDFYFQQLSDNIDTSDASIALSMKGTYNLLNRIDSSYTTKQELQDVEYVTAKAILDLKDLISTVNSSSNASIINYINSSLNQYNSSLVERIMDLSSNVIDIKETVTTFNILKSDVYTINSSIDDISSRLNDNYYTKDDVSNHVNTNDISTFVTDTSLSENYLPLAGGVMNTDASIKLHAEDDSKGDRYNLVSRRGSELHGRTKDCLSFTKAIYTDNNYILEKYSDKELTDRKSVISTYINNDHSLHSVFERNIDDTASIYKNIIIDDSSIRDIIGMCTNNKITYYIYNYVNYKESVTSYYNDTNKVLLCIGIIDTDDSQSTQNYGIFVKGKTTNDLITAYGGVKTIGSDIAPLKDGKIPTDYLNLDNYITSNDISTLATVKYVDDTSKLLTDSINNIINTSLANIDSSIDDISSRLNKVKENFDTLVGDGADLDGTINTFKEIESFLKDVSDGSTLTNVLMLTKESILNDVSTNYAKLNDVSNHVTKEELENVISKEIRDLKDSINTTNSSISNIITDSSQYLISNDVSEFVTNASLTDKLDDYYTKTESDNKFVTLTVFNDSIGELQTNDSSLFERIMDLSSNVIYIDNSLNILKSDVDTINSSIDDISSRIKNTTDSLSNYATKTDVDTINSSIDDISSRLNDNYYTIENISTNFVSNASLTDNFVSNASLTENYLTITDASIYATKQELQDVEYVTAKAILDLKDKISTVNSSLTTLNASNNASIINYINSSIDDISSRIKNNYATKTELSDLSTNIQLSEEVIAATLNMLNSSIIELYNLINNK